MAAARDAGVPAVSVDDGDEHLYGFPAVAEILDVSENKLRYWSQIGFVGPSVKRSGKQLFTFQDLISAKAFKELTDRGIKPAQIRKALHAVRASLPHIDRPLDRMRVAFDGESLVVVDGDWAFEPTGQRVLDFGLGDLARRVAEVRGRPEPELGALGAPARMPAPAARSAYDWFCEGARLEVEDGGADEAAACYERALEVDPGLAAAHTNLGTLAHRRGDPAAARASFEAALAVDPDQPEARFNLANLILESGDFELAVAELRRVLQLAPDFGDAHFNLALALERLGGRSQARAHLERYLELEAEPAGPSADEARALIARLERQR